MKSTMIGYIHNNIIIFQKVVADWSSQVHFSPPLWSFVSSSIFPQNFSSKSLVPFVVYSFILVVFLDELFSIPIRSFFPWTRSYLGTLHTSTYIVFLHLSFSLHLRSVAGSDFLSWLLIFLHLIILFYVHSALHNN